VLAGWVQGIPAMVRPVPGSPAMSINTAVMFFMSGIGLLAHVQRRRRVTLAIGLVQILLAAAILFEHIADIDLGIDLASVHHALGDGHSKPGRTSPNACLAFLATGIVLVLQSWPLRRRWRKWTSALLAALVLLIGLTAVLGYLMRLDAMYQLAQYNKMAVLTGLGISVLGAGLWQLQRPGVPTDGVQGEAQRITLMAVVLLSGLALATGMASFATLRHMYESSTAEHHRQMASSAAAAVAAALERELTLVQSLARRAELQDALTRLAARPRDAQAREAANLALEAFAEAGLRVTVELGPEWHSMAGSDQPAPHDGWLPIGGTAGVTAALGQRHYLTLRTETLFGEPGQLRLVTEKALSDVQAALRSLHATTASTDALLCIYSNGHALCFPSRFYPNGLRAPLAPARGRPVLPVGLALQGRTGSMEVRDPRGVEVLAGYAPVPGQPLAVVVKTDARELYLPLRERLHLMLAAVLVLVGAGTWLLRRRVQPLIGRIVAERQRIKAILDHSNDAFVACGTDGLVTDWNREAERLFGYPASMALGRPLAALLAAPEEQARLEAELARFLDNGRDGPPKQRHEMEAQHRSGRRLPVEVSIARFRTGDMIGASIFLRDLSERRAAEQQAQRQQAALEQARLALNQAQKLEAVGKLTGGVAHDFNNVLQVIKGSLELLGEENHNRYRVIRRIDTAMGAVERGAKLATQLLAFARRQPLHPKPTDLGRIVRSMGDMLQRALGDGIEIETVEGEALWTTAVDPHQLEQVILNLAINARDAMQGRGHLTIEVGNALLDEDYVRGEPGLAPGQYVMLAMSDTGSGMTPEVREKAFEPFFSTKPEGQGTGLGLSMTYGFVKQSGGHIRIYSEPGHGTTIKLYLPRCHEPEQVPSRPEPAAAVGGTETVLVVEDDAAVRRTVCDLLGSLGYRVLQAPDAGIALGMLEQGCHIDLLFTDVVMPGAVRSPELARRARALLPGVRVLFTSGYTRNAIVHGGRLDPGVHLLSKPYGREQLARKVREVLDRPDSGVPRLPDGREATESAVSAALDVAAGRSVAPAAVLEAPMPAVPNAAPAQVEPVPAATPAHASLETANEGSEAANGRSQEASPSPAAPGRANTAPAMATGADAPSHSDQNNGRGNSTAAPAPSAHPLRIAFVEDNDDFRMMGSELLGILGHQVMSFPDAEQALPHVRGEHFDALLTDLSLPGMSGIELAEQLAPKQPALRIIVASGYGDAVQGRSEVPIEVLPKPFTLQQLRECFGQFSVDASQ
jgi:PAS domain S-box-containing protein